MSEHAQPIQTAAVPKALRLLAGLAWLAVLVSALLVVYTTHHSRQLLGELERLTREQNRLDADWGRLLLERSTQGSLDKVEKVARDTLGMREPKIDEIRVIQR